MSILESLSEARQRHIAKGAERDEIEERMAIESDRGALAERLRAVEKRHLREIAPLRREAEQEAAETEAANQTALARRAHRPAARAAAQCALEFSIVRDRLVAQIVFLADPRISEAQVWVLQLQDLLAPLFVADEVVDSPGYFGTRRRPGNGAELRRAMEALRRVWGDLEALKLAVGVDVAAEIGRLRGEARTIAQQVGLAAV